GAVRAEGDGVDVVLVPTQFGDLLARVHGPEADGVIGARAGQAGVVRGEGHAVDVGPVLPDGDLLPVPPVPQAGRAVRRTRPQPAAVGAPGEPVDAVRVTFEGPHLLPAGHVPDADRRVAVVARRGEPAAVGAEGHVAHHVPMPAEHTLWVLA